MSTLHVSKRCPVAWAFVIVMAANVGHAEQSQVERGQAEQGDDIDIYNVSVYYGEDSSSALQLSADWALSGATRLNLGAAYVHAHGSVDTLDSYQANAEVDHRIGRWGFAVEGDYRDDDGMITTAGLRGRGYYGTEQMHAGVRLGRSRIEVSYDLSAFLRRFVDDTQSTYSTEYGLDLRYSFDKLAIYANGTDYDYDEPLSSLAARIDRTRLPNDQFPLLQARLAAARARLAQFNFASLRLANNLLDYSVVLGADYRFGEQLLNVELSRQQLAINSIVIDSVEAGWTFPIGKAVDMEVRIGNAQMQGADPLLYGSINFSFYR
jgi:hypothetical protein